MNGKEWGTDHLFPHKSLVSGGIQPVRGKGGLSPIYPQFTQFTPLSIYSAQAFANGHKVFQGKYQVRRANTLYRTPHKPA